MHLQFIDLLALAWPKPLLSLVNNPHETGLTSKLKVNPFQELNSAVKVLLSPAV